MSMTKQSRHLARQKFLTTQHELGVILERAKQPDPLFKLNAREDRVLEQAIKILDRKYKSVE